MMQKAITVEELCNKLKPLFGKKIDELYFRYSIANSLEEKNEIHGLLTSLYQKHLSQLLDKGVLLEPPKESQVSGEYPLGKVSYAEKELFDFSLREDDWPRHVCVSGMSGSGKTTFAFQILNNFIEKKKPFLVFDWKRSFRPLLNIDKSLMNFTIGNETSNFFKTNINRPPKGVEPKEWINTLCDLLTETFSASYGVHKILLETLDEAFEGWGVYDGGKHYPNWQHIKKLLEQKSKDAKGRETGWYESAMRISSVLTFGAFGKVVNYDGKRSLSIEDLFDKRVVFELNSLSNIEKKFFAEYILTYIFKLKKAKQNKVDGKFNYAILVDEAHNIFLRRQTNFMAESVTDMIYREMREYGTSLICLDQHISKISDTVTGNSACHVAFQQQLPSDIEEVSSIMQNRDRKDLFSLLPVGSAIVKMSDRFNSPFLLKVPFMNLRKESISDEELQTRMQFLLNEMEVKKYDPEFLEEIKSPENNMEEPVEEEQKESIEIEKNKHDELRKEMEKMKDSKKDISETQKILSDFILSQMKDGISLNKIQRMLENNANEKLYSQNDINCAIDFSIKSRLDYRKENSKEFLVTEMNLPKIKGYFEEHPIPFESEEIHIQEDSFDEDKNSEDKSEIEEVDFDISKNHELNNEEQKFLEFLFKNPEHKKPTTEIYKTIGLSARKGNVVKNKLLEKNLISIEEERNEFGWKKYIRLN